MKQHTMSDKLSFHLVFEPEREGGFTVTVPAISGCISYGATFEEATTNIHEALLLCLEDMIARGEDIPSDVHAPIISAIELSPEELHA